MDINCFYVKIETGGKLNAFSLFYAFLFPERNKKRKRYVRAIAENSIRNRFARFKCGNFDLEDQGRSGMLAIVVDTQTQALL